VKTGFSHIIGLSLLVALTILSCSQSIVFANSPPFGRQEVKDDHGDVLHVNGYNLTATKVVDDNYYHSIDRSSDIETVDYFSDGKLLNATMWLAGPILQHPENVSNVVYGVLIDADSNRATGKDGVDYQVEMQWNNATKTWIRFFTEYSTQGYPRVLSEDLNYSKPFFSNGSNYILLYINLADISSPTKYRIAFYSEIIHNISDSVIDYTNWVDIPPIQYAISTTPENPVTLRQGETKDIGITLKSTSGPVPVLNYLLENHSAINLEINRLKPSQSFEPTELRIGAPSNAPTGQYVMPVRANISVESPFPSSFLNLKYFYLKEDGKITPYSNLTAHGYIAPLTNLTVAVLQSETAQQQFKEFWDTYGQPISIFAGGFFGGATSLIFDRLKRKHEEKNRARLRPT
jgi:hypothetical protein